MHHNARFGCAHMSNRNIRRAENIAVRRENLLPLHTVCSQTNAERFRWVLPLDIDGLDLF